MHDAVANLLRSPLVPELRPDVAARPPRDVHRRLVDVPALGQRHTSFPFSSSTISISHRPLMGTIINNVFSICPYLLLEPSSNRPRSSSVYASSSLPAAFIRIFDAVESRLDALRRAPAAMHPGLFDWQGGSQKSWFCSGKVSVHFRQTLGSFRAKSRFVSPPREADPGRWGGASPLVEFSFPLVKKSASPCEVFVFPCGAKGHATLEPRAPRFSCVPATCRKVAPVEGRWGWLQGVPEAV